MSLSKGSDPGLRVLFLHELDSAPGSEKQRLLEKAVGKQRIKAPNLKTRQSIMMFVLLFLVLALCLGSSCIAAFVLARWYVSFAVFLASVALLALTYWLGGKGATHYMWLKAVKIAEKKFKEQRTNVIVGTSFGAVVALSMDVPKVPMLLLSPAHEQYSRFMRLKNAFTLHAIPYVLIVHGSNDKTVPLDDSIRLLETADGPGRSRLEVIKTATAAAAAAATVEIRDDSHGLKSIKPEELRQWVDEVYTQGKLQVKMLAESGSKDVDASLFSWEESELALPTQKEAGTGGDKDEQDCCSSSSNNCSSSSSVQRQQRQQQQETLVYAHLSAAASGGLAEIPFLCGSLTTFMSAAAAAAKAVAAAAAAAAAATRVGEARSTSSEAASLQQREAAALPAVLGKAGKRDRKFIFHWLDVEEEALLQVRPQLSPVGEGETPRAAETGGFLT
ncbi:hypothetical protein Emed_003318 [Eimeria media]